MLKGSRGIIKAGSVLEVRGEDRKMTIRNDTPATFVTDSFPPGTRPSGDVMVQFGSIQGYLPGSNFVPEKKKA